MSLKFTNRQDAGRRLADALAEYAGRDDALVLGLPRGGVPVAYEVANRLDLPLDVLLVRKLGVPGQEELAMGAIAWGHIRVLNRDVVDQLGIPQFTLEHIIGREQAELERRNQLYRDDKPAPDVDGRTVILVDDGLATGATMKAAVSAMRQAGTARIIVAVPVGPCDTCRELEEMVDDVVCLSAPRPFYAVGQGYQNFDQTSDPEVIALLAKAGERAINPRTPA